MQLFAVDDEKISRGSMPETPALTEFHSQF